jgi:hypothetical protein
MKFTSENIEKAKKIGLFVGGGIGLIIVLGMVFDGSGQPNETVALPKTEVNVIEPATTAKSQIEEASKIRQDKWKEIKVCWENLKLDSQALEREIRTARGQQWIQQAQKVAGSMGEPNLAYLQRQFTVYSGRTQAIAQYNGGDVLNTSSAKITGNFRENLNTALDIATAIDLLGANLEPRPTVVTGEFEDSLDKCLTTINDYNAINKEELRKIQQEDYQPEQTEPEKVETDVSDSGSAKATGEE